MLQPPIFSARWLLLTLALLLILPAVAVTAAPSETGSDPADLPLLRPGFNLGTTFYGGSERPDDDALLARVSEAAEQGMDSFVFYVDWPELEAERGAYTLDGLQDMLAWVTGLGLQPFVNLTFIDIDTPALPDDLSDLPLDHPRTIERLHALLDEVVPLLLEHDGFLLLLGNEVDGYFAEEPDALDGYVRLIESARAHVHRLAPELAVGVTLTGTETRDQGPVFQALRPVTDVIPFNYYGIVAEPTVDWLRVLPEADIRADIAHYMDIYGDAPVIIQELGCPSAPENGSSLAAQETCFDVMLDALSSYPNVRFASIFTLADFDPATCEVVVEFFGLTEDMLPEPLFSQWRGYLCTLGMLNADATPKPAWDVFLGYLR